jgi:hypothetical protein
MIPRLELRLVVSIATSRRIISRLAIDWDKPNSTDCETVLDHGYPFSR